jgi:hypothetical protein
MIDTAFKIDKLPLTQEFRFEVRNRIHSEWAHAVQKFPWWPSNIFVGQSVVSEECGEACKATLDYVQKPDSASLDGIIKEHAQAAAMHMRQMQYLIGLKQESLKLKEGE